MKNFNIIKFKMAGLWPVSIIKLSRNAIHSPFFYVLLHKLYHISILLHVVARMSSKLGKIRTESRSWQPKWPIIVHCFFNMCNIWKTGPDSCTIKNFNMIKFKMADLRPLPIVKFSRKRDSLNIFLCFARKFIPYPAH